MELYRSLLGACMWWCYLGCIASEGLNLCIAAAAGEGMCTCFRASMGTFSL